LRGILIFIDFKFWRDKAMQLKGSWNSAFLLGFFWIGSFVYSKPVIAVSSEVTQLVERKDCAQHLLESNGILDQFLKVWFLDPQSPTNVNQHFKRLLLRHDDFFKWLNELEKNRQGLPPADEIGSALIKLDKAQGDILAQLSVIFRHEDTFMMSLSALEQAFMDLKKPFEATNARCKENAKDVLVKSDQVISDLTQGLLKMRLYVAESRKKRLALLSAIHQVYRSRLLQAQGDEIRGRIDTLRDGIDAALIGDQFLLRVGAWRRKSTIPGLARGYITNLNFTKSLRYLHADYQEGLELRTQLLALPNLKDGARGIISYEIESNLTLLEKQIKKLEASGWKPMFAHQKEDVAYRRTLSSATEDRDCASALDAFDGLALSCDSLEKFQIVETAYEQVRIFCLFRRPVHGI
jgi:hypothetical protein